VIIEKAGFEQFEDVRSFYHSLIDGMQNRIIKKQSALMFLGKMFLLKDYTLAWVSSIFIPYQCTMRTRGNRL